MGALSHRIGFRSCRGTQHAEVRGQALNGETCCALYGACLSSVLQTTSDLGQDVISMNRVWFAPETLVSLD